MLNFLLNKGGAGVSLSRAETVERLNPILHRAYPLLHRYDAVAAAVREKDVAERLAVLNRTFHADIGKLNETIFSAGGVAYNGIDLDPAAYPASDGDAALFDLADEERAFEEAVGAEFDLRPRHQIRTQAILGVVRGNSQNRLDYLDDLTRTRRR